MLHRFGSAACRRPLLAVIVSAGIVAPANSWSGADVVELEEVLVTAQKREQSQFKVPLSVAVVSGDALSDLGIDAALGLSYKVPGLLVQESAPGNAWYTIRGIGNSVGLLSLVGVYLDEVDVTNVSIAGQYDISLYDLERVEVLRGPQGTLYGASAAGGVIRIITQRPQLDAWRSKAETSLFVQQRGSPGWEVKAAVNAPIAEDKFGLRLAVNHHDWGGWIDQPAADRQDVNDNRMTDLRLRGLWAQNARFSVDGTAIVHRNRGGGTNIANLPPYAESLFQTFIDPAEGTPYVDDYEHYSATVNLDFRALTLTSATGYFLSDQHGATARRFEFNYPFVPELPGSDVYSAITHYHSESRLFTEELRLGSESHGPVTWLAGLFLRREDAVDDYRATRALGDLVVETEAMEQQSRLSDSWSVYANAAWAFAEQWEAGGGLRYFEDSRRQTDPTGDTSQQARFHDVSPRVHISFAPSDRVIGYASITQGFRSGGFNGSVVEQYGAPTTYGPENATTGELGAKYRATDKRFQVELAVFESEYRDMQGIGLIPGALVEVVWNIGRARIDGIEWSLEWWPVERTRLQFNGSIIDARFVELDAENTSHLPGDPVDQVADYAWSLMAEHEFSCFGDDGCFLRTGYDRQGPVHFTERSLGLKQPFGVSDPLGFLHASLGMRIGTAVVEVFGRNLLDEHDRSNPLAFSSLETQPRPRVLGIRVAAEFR